jgi:hypothetical protein
MTRLRAVALAFTLLAAAPLTVPLAAQGTPAAELPGRIVAVNPFLPLFGFFQGEFESRVNRALTVAVASSYTEWNTDRTFNLDAKVRWYGQERAPTGLGMAASLGVGRVQREGLLSCDYSPVMPMCTTRDRGPLTVPAFAVEGQYQWLLGSRKNTAVSVGFGVKRYFASESEMDGNVRPTGRLTIGYAFK